MRTPSAVGGMVIAAVLLVSCATSPAPSPADTEEAPSAEATPETVELSADAIQEWVESAEWSFAPNGILEPMEIAFQDGEATDDLSRIYEIGVGVEGDANQDGIVDLAVPVSQLDGNAILELWYIWLGTDADADPVAEQVIYPIGRTTRCGDGVHSVTAGEGGFTVDQTLWLPNTDADRDCASGGTGTQVREITVEEIDGVSYPIQTAPIAAWGGICPRSEWLDGIPDDTVEGRAAPPASAPPVIEAGETVALYELPDATLVTSSGVSFFGFQPESLAAETQDEAEQTPVRMHCAFAGS